MPAQLYISSAASGKTQAVLERVQEASRANPKAEIWVLLLDRAQVKAFRSRFGTSWHPPNVHIGIFSDFYYEILERAGVRVYILDQASIRLLVQAAIEDLFDEGQLTFFGPIHDTPGFARVIVDRVAELKRALVTSEMLKSQASGEIPGLSEIASIYENYQHRIQSSNWADPEGISWLAINALEESPGLLKNCSFIAVDGFDDFTPAQRSMLAQVARRVPELMITFPGDREMSRPAFRRFRRAFDALRAALEPEIHLLPGAIRIPKPLAYLEKELFEQASPYTTQDADRIVLLEASNPAAEAREALRWFKALIRREHFQPGDCAMFTQDPDLYAPFLREAAAEFGLPLHITWNEPLAAAPAVSALLSLLELPIVDYPRREILDAVRSPFFDLSEYGISPEDATRLEQISLYSQVTGGYRQWQEALEVLAAVDSQSDENIPETDRTPYRIPEREQIVRLQAALSAWYTGSNETGKKSLPGWIAWLKKYLDKLRFFELCGLAVGEAIERNLQAIITVEGVPKSRKVSYAQFFTGLRRFLQATSYAPQRPPTNAAILAGRIVEARGVRFRAVAILGLSEGVFPIVERADPFIDETSRSTLGLEPQIGRMQGGLFYQAVTRANEYLLLTRPYLAEGGEAWVASPYWTAVQRLFPDSIVRIKSEDFRAIDQAASPEEYLFWSVRARQPAKDFSDRFDRFQQAAQILQARFGHASQSSPLTALQADLSAFVTAGPPWSPSRLETYGSCPYRFYAEYMLSLQALEAPQPGFDLLQLGSMIHEILEQVHRQAADPSEPEAVRAALPEVAEKIFDIAPEKYGFRPSVFWEVEQQELLERVERSLDRLSAESQGWTPFQYECKFGFDSAQPLSVETPAGAIRLRGVIDRIDRDESGRLRIIDYKTGSYGLGKKDLLEGRRLQLPLYALAARQALRLGVPAEAFYWSVNAASSFCSLSHFRSEDGEGIEAAIKVALDYVAHFIAGILEGRFSPDPPKGGCPSYCPAAAWCWRYSPGHSR